MKSVACLEDTSRDAGVGMGSASAESVPVVFWGWAHVAERRLEGRVSTKVNCEKPRIWNSASAEGSVFVVSLDSFVLDVAPTGGSKGSSVVTADVVSEKNFDVCTRALVTVSESSLVVAVVSMVKGWIA